VVFVVAQQYYIIGQKY